MLETEVYRGLHDQELFHLGMWVSILMERTFEEPGRTPGVTIFSNICVAIKVLNESFSQPLAGCFILFCIYRFHQLPAGMDLTFLVSMMKWTFITGRRKNGVNKVLKINRKEQKNIKNKFSGFWQSVWVSHFTSPCFPVCPGRTKRHMKSHV